MGVPGCGNDRMRAKREVLEAVAEGLRKDDAELARLAVDETRVDAADEKCRHGYLMSDLCAACLRPRTTPPPAPEGVDAADVLAGLQDDIFCECGVQHIVTMKPEAVLAALREAAGGGWVCIAPDGTLWERTFTPWADSEKLLVRPVVGP